MRRQLSEVLPWAGMVEEGICLTKDGVLLAGFQVAPTDLGFAGHEQVIAVIKSLDSVFRTLGDGWHIYVDSRRKRIGATPTYCREDAPVAVQEFEAERPVGIGQVFDSDFFVIFGKDVSEADTIGNWLFSSSDESKDEGRSIRKGLKTFLGELVDIESALYNVFNWTNPLNSHDFISYLHTTVGGSQKVSVPEVPFYLDTMLADRRVLTDGPVKIGDEYLSIASIHDFPDQTHSAMASRLMQVDEEFRFVTRFSFMSRDSAKSKIKAIRRTHSGKRKGAGAMFQEAVLKEESELLDTEALAQTGDASEALSLLASGTIRFGQCSSVIMTYDKSARGARERMNRVRSVVQAQEFVCKEESIGAFGAWLGTMPGNLSHNPRQSVISTRSLAHLMPISGSWIGEDWSAHLAELTGVRFPLMYGRSGADVFRLNLGVGDVGHTLVVGPTGAGKSVLLSALAMSWIRFPGTRVVFFDKDRSSESSTVNVGGQFFDLGGEGRGGLRVNPFADIENGGYRIWLADFIVTWLKERGVDVPDDDRGEYISALEQLIAMAPEDRGWKSFVDSLQTKQGRAALMPFVEGDPARFFQHGHESFGDSVWTAFETNELLNADVSAAQFVLLYLFRKLGASFDDKAPTLLVLDEAWLFLDHPVFSAMLRDWLKTLRKKNVYVVLATQELGDLKGDIGATVTSACLTKIFLPNANAQQEYEVYERMGCSAEDVEAISDGVPKREYLYFSTKGRQLFEMGLTKEALSLLTSAKKENVYA